MQKGINGKDTIYTHFPAELRVKLQLKILMLRVPICQLMSQPDLLIMRALLWSPSSPVLELPGRHSHESCPDPYRALRLLPGTSRQCPGLL